MTKVAEKIDNGKADLAITPEWIDQQIAQRKVELERLKAEAYRAIGELQGRIAELEQFKHMLKDIKS